jgi:hypothetical protein
MMLIYSDYKIYLLCKINGEGVDNILRDGLRILVPLFSRIALEREDVFEDFGILLCYINVFRNLK